APPAGLVRGIRLPSDVVEAEVAAAREAAGQPRRQADKTDYPVPAVEGEVRGLALMVDFSDEPATIAREDLARFLNEPGYAENGNQGSVRDYYRDISEGRLDLTHEVSTYYYRAAHPKAWYEDPNQPPGWRARQLVTEALEDLERRGMDFTQFDVNGDGFIDLVSLFYAGSPSWGWATGLWPQAGEAGFRADGVVARLWQISPLGDSLSLGIPVHEIGHALCQWPDLYDLGGESWGIGGYCIMSVPTDYANPIEPCGPLKLDAGWTETIVLDGVMLDLEAPADGNRVFVRHHPSVQEELYVIENRRRAGRDLDLPDEGLAIWHVDWQGSNNREARSPDIHYMVTLVQADGLWDLENRVNQGDEDDLWGAPGATEFNPDTDPPARWWRIPEADLYLSSISGPGEVVTFDFDDGVGVYPMDLRIEPGDLGAHWRITGADGYVKNGVGSRLAYVPTVGSYLVTWGEVPGWLEPPAETVLITGDGPPPVLEALYTHPPFAVTEVPSLGEPARGSGGQAVDFDDDGDLDLSLGRLEGGDVLLRNDGGWQFTDVTPPALAEEASTLTAHWADVDADGDRDVFVVRRDAPAFLLRQTAPGQFGQPEGLPEDIATVRGAMWIDFDGDERLDLHLVRDGEADLLLQSPDKTAPTLGEFTVLDILPGIGFLRHQSAAWCDYDLNGRLDLYTTTLFGSNVLARNLMPDRFDNATHGGLGQPWRDGAVAWGDYDNDGDFDLYTTQDGAADVLFTQYAGVFVIESGANLGTIGAGKDVVWADFDNDGDLDLYLARHGQHDRVLLNDGHGLYVEAPTLIGALDGASTAAIPADLDGDGGIDLTITRDGEPTLLLHNTMNRGDWLQVSLEGSGSLREPVGAVLAAHVGQRTLLRHVAARSGPSSVARRVHFGLGTADVVDSLRVTWPDGSVQTEYDVASGQVLMLRQNASEGGDDQTPAVTRMRNPYPNPFNPGTTLAFDLARTGHVRLQIFDVRGRRVATVHDGELAAGVHEFRWQGRSDAGRRVASGTYLARFEGDGVVQNHRLMLIK
ncbi:M6 family metalloprotease domain-containing protein, partial [bacterium]|nr:M6 family metalloprotease domain-containing protein [bacterium]